MQTAILRHYPVTFKFEHTLLDKKYTFQQRNVWTVNMLTFNRRIIN